MKKTALAILAFAFPLVTFAQASLNNSRTLPELFSSIITFINTIAVPLIFALAFVFFLFGVFKYFFGSGKTAEENRRQGRQYVMYGLIGFFVMISLWGLVNIAVRTFGFDNQTMPPLPVFGPSSGTQSPSTETPGI